MQMLRTWALLRTGMAPNQCASPPAPPLYDQSFQNRVQFTYYNPSQETEVTPAAPFAFLGQQFEELMGL